MIRAVNKLVDWFLGVTAPEEGIRIKIDDMEETVKGVGLSSHTLWNIEGDGTIPIPRRPLTFEEMSWVKVILASNKDWKDVVVQELFAISKCGCGLCRTVILEPSATPQNPEAAEKYGDVGQLDISSQDDKVYSVFLFHKDGVLSSLEVVGYDDDPVPEYFEEISRHVWNLDNIRG